METTFRLKASELNSSFINTLKRLFNKGTIELTVTNVIEEDETSFLLKNTKNRKHLLKAIDDIKNNRNLVRFSAEEFKEFNK
jgi:hypothetical protein